MMSRGSNVLATTVVVPAYNHGHLIGDTLDSIMISTMWGVHIIVVNDGSPDDTNGVMFRYGNSDRITLIQQSNSGQAAARNRGLAMADSEFVAFLDDDDRWPPDKLAWQVDYLRSHPQVGMVFGSAQLIGCGQSYELPGTNRSHPTLETLFEGCPLVSPGQALFRTALLRKVGGFDPTVWGADDFDLYFRLARVSELHFVNKLSLIYRLHDGNASRDVLRMYRNCDAVLKRHLVVVPPQDQSRLQRQASAFLSSHYRERLYSEAWAHLRQGRIRSAVACAYAYLKLFAQTIGRRVGRVGRLFLGSEK